MSDEREFTTAENDAWNSFAAVLGLLPAALNSQLVRDSDVTLFDFSVLQFLHAAADQTMRVSALAACTSATLPRMSKVASRLEAEGLVSRNPCSSDGRAVNITLTPAGRRALTKAAPGHIEFVRELVFDVLTPAQVEQLREIASSLLARLHPDTACPVDRQVSADRG